MGRGQVYTPPGVARIYQALGYTVGLLGGVAFVVMGSFLAWDNVSARWYFRDAERVSAVVVEADYVKPQWKQGASFISVDVAGAHDVRASVDNVFQAPDGLSAGDHVTVLYDASRPGHALFPGQLGWTKLMVPGGLFFLAGLVPIIGYGWGFARRVAVYLRKQRKRYAARAEARLPWAERTGPVGGGIGTTGC
ncbi:DUF3592 domain-containing protein [Streptomyces sp. NPDC048290]|uniref:DUF3592 domain-containing protein n=1 Tax=Streptomyces sp. NPDC048290 TaxID=3155811 RepID=UPI003438829D